MNRYEQAAREMEALKDTPEEIAGLVPAKVKVSKNAAIVYSLRMTPDEFTRISKAAKKSGVTLAAYLRTAALAAAEDDSKLSDAERTVAVQEVREKARELVEAVSKL